MELTILLAAEPFSSSSEEENPGKGRTSKGCHGRKAGRENQTTAGTADQVQMSHIDSEFKLHVRRLEQAEADCDKHEVEEGDKKGSLPFFEKIDKPRMR